MRLRGRRRRTDVFATGSDGAIWHRSLHNHTWSPWESLGGRFTSGPTAVSTEPGRIDVFGRGTDGAVWGNTYAFGRWPGWYSLGGSILGEPDVSSWGAGRLDVFATGADARLWHSRSAAVGGSNGRRFPASRCRRVPARLHGRWTGSTSSFGEPTAFSGAVAWLGQPGARGTGSEELSNSAPAVVSRGAGTARCLRPRQRRQLWQESYNLGWGLWTPSTDSTGGHHVARQQREGVALVGAPESAEASGPVALYVGTTRFLSSAATRQRRPRLANRRRHAVSNVADLRGSWDLFNNLTLRELRSKYKRSVLGWTWSLLNPLATMADLRLVFRVFLKMQAAAGRSQRAQRLSPVPAVRPAAVELPRRTG